MATRAVVVFEDDLNGGPAVETVAFGLDGVDFEIDLSARNAARLRDALERYVAAARRVDGRTNEASLGSPAWSVKMYRDRLAEIRAWARSTGTPINSRGRIPVAVVRAYYEATS